MKYSFKAWSQDTTYRDLLETWARADRQEVWDAMWLNDHLYPPKSPPDRPIMEAWSLMAAMAAVTSRIRFGVMVTANTFRHPSVLAKMATTIDHISDGRLNLGIGAGWHEGEHTALGIRLPPLKERFDRLDETFAIVHGLMTEEVFDFAGRHHTLKDAHFEPKPVQKPRPPFVVGGAGMKRTIPLAARWADHWNYPDYVYDPDDFAVKLARLSEACAEIGRDPGEIEVSVQFRSDGDVAEVLERADAYEEIGADHLLVSLVPPADAEAPDRIAEALGNR
ncbi:MAG TPA: TIGR03560 family F420-dependent LLM class oxidoreductase [Acidimicrobiia bacterium]|jgi:F420-dependent oxidoreductase-like protein|nr:TIGR03560 family F420-dependent LLM class oxidoreductase [Acidimicrobiia bacterium]